MRLLRSDGALPGSTRTAVSPALALTSGLKHTRDESKKKGKRSLGRQSTRAEHRKRISQHP